MKFNLTNLLALLGSITGSIALAWNILKERRRLDIKAKIGYDYSYVNGAKALIVTITNVGRPPILLRCIGFIKNKKRFMGPETEHMGYSNGSFQPIGLAVGKSLSYGESISLSFLHFESFFQNKYRYLFVIDSLEKRWALKQRRMRALRKSAQKLDELK